jgi:aminomuconate-semialdehyde/2-hydroxymuconate-6-semialdehyde dehydrogenase
MTDLLNYIDGQLVPAVHQQWLDNVQPATGKVYSRIPRSGAADVQNAVDAARRVFPEWSSMPVGKRSAILSRLAD